MITGVGGRIGHGVFGHRHNLEALQNLRERHGSNHRTELLQRDGLRFLASVRIVVHGVGIIATDEGEISSVIIVEIAEHTTHGFLFRARDRGSLRRFAEFSDTPFDGGLFLSCQFLVGDHEDGIQESASRLRLR